MFPCITSNDVPHVGRSYLIIPNSKIQVRLPCLSSLDLCLQENDLLPESSFSCWYVCLMMFDWWLLRINIIVETCFFFEISLLWMWCTNSWNKSPNKYNTLPKTNIAPARTPFQKETHLPTQVFRWYVSFRGCIPLYSTHKMGQISRDIHLDVPGS